MLASALGYEKRVDIITGTANELQLDPGALHWDHASSILERLSSEPGIVGVAARYAGLRLHRHHSTSPELCFPPEEEVAEAVPSSGRAVDLVSPLAPALGLSRARELVVEECKRQHFEPNSLSDVQAGSVLTALSSKDGIVGVAARFAQTRLGLTPST